MLLSASRSQVRRCDTGGLFHCDLSFGVNCQSATIATARKKLIHPQLPDKSVLKKLLVNNELSTRVLEPITSNEDS
jgi:hypothetical protein